MRHAGTGMKAVIRVDPLHALGNTRLLQSVRRVPSRAKNKRSSDREKRERKGLPGNAVVIGISANPHSVEPSLQHGRTIAPPDRKHEGEAVRSADLSVLLLDILGERAVRSIAADVHLALVLGKRSVRPEAHRVQVPHLEGMPAVSKPAAECLQDRAAERLPGGMREDDVCVHARSGGPSVSGRVLLRRTGGGKERSKTHPIP